MSKPKNDMFFLFPSTYLGTFVWLILHIRKIWGRWKRLPANKWWRLETKWLKLEYDFYLLKQTIWRQWETKNNMNDVWTDEEIATLKELVHANNIGAMLLREEQQTANTDVCQFKGCILWRTWPARSVKAASFMDWGSRKHALLNETA